MSEKEKNSKDKKKNREDALLIIRLLEKAERLSTLSRNIERKAYILYFLGYMYYKYDDLVTAKDKLKKCIKLRSKVRKPAIYLLTYIWDYKMKPPFWRWWLYSPLHTWIKRICFSFISILIFFLLVIHPCMHGLAIDFCRTIGTCGYLSDINWATYLYFISILVFIILIPTIQRLKLHDIEIELNTPPLYEPLLTDSGLTRLDLIISTPRDLPTRLNRDTPNGENGGS